MSNRFILFVLAIVTTYAYSDTSCSNILNITDDPFYTAVLESTRDIFLAKRNPSFNRLDATLLIPNGEGSWLRGGINHNNPSYPASTVKFPYLIRAIEWCKSQGLKYDCLDEHVRPMIYESDNFETGVVVDVISGAINYDIDAPDSKFKSWVELRNNTATYLDERGQLENQVILHKTYSTNTGNPHGAEKLARDYYGSNLMTPKCAASLMAEVVSGKLHPDARDYILQMMHHTRFSYTTLGPGLPPGTYVYTKIGFAYDTLEEIAYIILPNKKRFILAIYTNGLEPGSYTYGLSWFVEVLISKLKELNSQLPPKYIFDTSSPNFSKSGQWDVKRDRQTYGNVYLETRNISSQAEWRFRPNVDSIFEVSFWIVSNLENCDKVQVSISDKFGKDIVNVNLAIFGGRWRRLGDFHFKKGSEYTIQLTIPPQCQGKLATIDSIKFQEWPKCNGIPGKPCIK